MEGCEAGDGGRETEQLIGIVRQIANIGSLSVI